MRTAHCRCGAVEVACTGEPVRISVCHCLDCQRRSGSAFAVQARFPADQVSIEGDTQVYRHKGDSGKYTGFTFCPACGATIAYRHEYAPELIAVPVGAFADPGFPTPKFSVWETRKHPWLEVIGGDVQHHD